MHIQADGWTFVDMEYIQLCSELLCIEAIQFSKHTHVTHTPHSPHTLNTCILHLLTTHSPPHSERDNRYARWKEDVQQSSMCGVISLDLGSIYTTSLGTRKPTWCPWASLILITQDHWIRNNVSVDRN